MRAFLILGAKAGDTAVIRFTKMQGLGNDYIYINAFEEYVDDPAALARKVSDRHFGVGSDGLVLIAPSETADFRMVMYNADGSRGAMCGNAARCVAKYVYDREMTQKTVRFRNQDAAPDGSKRCDAKRLRRYGRAHSGMRKGSLSAGTGAGQKSTDYSAGTHV